jgi:class 3 adenylate cyclase
VSFSDIVGFTDISSKCEAPEIINMLNELYCCFDANLEKHRVYKVMMMMMID